MEKAHPAPVLGERALCVLDRLRVAIDRENVALGAPLQDLPRVTTTSYRAVQIEPVPAGLE